MLGSDTEKYYKERQPLAFCDLCSSPRLALTSLHERLYCLVYAHLSYISIIFFKKGVYTTWGRPLDQNGLV